jgi:uncharacterized protein (DUF924 family)
LFYAEKKKKAAFNRYPNRNEIFARKSGTADSGFFYLPLGSTF